MSDLERDHEALKLKFAEVQLENEKVFALYNGGASALATERLKVSVLDLKLVAADAVMHKIDRAVDNQVLGSRSAIADARLNYGDPHVYEHASKELLDRLED